MRFRLRSPGDSRIVAAASTHFPANRSYGYAFQFKHALDTTTTRLSSGSPVSDAGLARLRGLLVWLLAVFLQTQSSSLGLPDGGICRAS